MEYVSSIIISAIINNRYVENNMRSYIGLDQE